MSSGTEQAEAPHPNAMALLITGLPAAGKSMSAKFPAASVVVCGCELVTMSAVTITAAMQVNKLDPCC